MAKRVAPSCRFAISDEDSFNDAILSPQYNVVIVKRRATTIEAGHKLVAIDRTYKNGERTSYAAEFQMNARVITLIIRSVMSFSLGIVGSIASMKGEIDPELMSAVRSSDHIVVDSPDLSGCEATLYPAS